MARLKQFVKVAIVAALFASVSCTNARCSSISSLGSNMRVTLYSGGETKGVTSV